MIESTAFATSRLSRHRARVSLPMRFTIPVHDAAQALEAQHLMHCLWWCWLSALARHNDSEVAEMAATPVSNSIRTHKTMPTGNDLPLPFTHYVPK